MDSCIMAFRSTPAYDTHDFKKENSLVSWSFELFASLAATFAVFWLNRNDSSPAEWNFNPIWTKAEKEQILTVANFTAHRSPERFIYRGLSLNSRHIDWHMFSEVSMRQYMKDEIRERLQMIRDTAESADGRCITPSHETLLHLAAGLGEVQLLNRLLQRHADPNVQIILPQQAFPSIPDSEQGNTPLTYACQPGMDDSTPLPVHNRISCLNLLIQYGADVNKPGPLGWPPLVITCVAGIGGAPYEEAALFLLKCGADISLQPELKGKKQVCSHGPRPPDTPCWSASFAKPGTIPISAGKWPRPFFP